MTESKPTRSIAERLNDHEAVREALWDGIRKALIRHMKLGETVVVGENGQVKELTPQELRTRLGVE